MEAPSPPIENPKVFRISFLKANVDPQLDLYTTNYDRYSNFTRNIYYSQEYSINGFISNITRDYKNFLSSLQVIYDPFGEVERDDIYEFIPLFELEQELEKLRRGKTGDLLYIQTRPAIFGFSAVFIVFYIEGNELVRITDANLNFLPDDYIIKKYKIHTLEDLINTYGLDSDENRIYGFHILSMTARPLFLEYQDRITTSKKTRKINLGNGDYVYIRIPDKYLENELKPIIIN